MAYVALFILLFCILYSPELFLIVFGLFVAGWREVERSLKPEYRIKHIIEREKERLNKVVDKYMRSLKKEEKDGNS